MSDGTTEAAAFNAAITLVGMGSKNTNLQRAGDNVAYVGEVLTGLVKTALMPLAVVNARAQKYFDSKFPEDLADKMKEVPPEFIASPKPSVAGPVLQGLGYSHEEDSLRDLYIGLLATSMDSRVAAKAHPGFAEIIGALSASEVGFLEPVLQIETMAAAELRSSIEGEQSWNVVYSHLVGLRNAVEPLLDEMLPAYIDNWVRLGLVRVNYDTYLTDETAYDWVDARPEYQERVRGLQDGQSITFAKGVIQRTAFGFAFAKAVGIL
ncbi:DUF4393 domain-containing protein [Cryobacterium sp. TMT1-3]|uniref:DUF4393 domain-containing protein n=1 Tax=Cryobacterium sp. TMT1-3 TaxID=1259237 RepID=UPI00141BBF3F|nr:DUF4393 domain-containing protein [Cryobacterium sp. TMT1-3]